jgi:hypothetical protein
MHNAETQEWRTVCDKAASGDFESLSHEEKVWFCTRELIDSTENGGLISYFYNTGADRLDYCIRALDDLNAKAVREQVLKQCQMFGADVPPTLHERNTIIRSWNRSVDSKIDEINTAILPLLADLDEKLNRFLKANICLSNK